MDVFVPRVLRVRKFKRTRIISRWASRTQTTWTTWKPRSWQKYLMANQRTVKFLRSLSLKWFLPTFPFPGEITFVDSKYDPISGESYGIPKKCTTLWQYQSWKGIFLLPNGVLPLTEINLIQWETIPPLHFFLSEVVNWINVWVCCAFGNVSLCQMTAMISSLNPDLPWLQYINSLLADYDVQVKTKTALNVVCLLSFLQLLKSFRSYLVVFKLVVLLEWCFNQEWSC